MKKVYSSLFATLFGVLSVAIQAQTDCSGNRYLDEIFSSYTLTSDIQYGSNISVEMQPVNLLLDVYQPQGDVETNRPLIIFAHGGSFIGGSKTDDGAVVTLCQHFARMGYVTASMNYRLESALNVLLSPNREKTFMEIVFRAVQDQKAAIRFFRKSVVEGGNPYGINPNIIIIGGSSAGGVLSMHTAYLNDASKIPAIIDTAAIGGGLEGNSGNPGYNSVPQAVVNLCGAIGDTAWMHNETTPLVSVHGDQDGTVPCFADTARPMGLPITLVYGSVPIHIKADNEGILNAVKIFYGQDHVPYQGNTYYMDTTITVVKTFLHDLICNQGLSTQEEDASMQMSIYPNPAQTYVNIRLNENFQGGLVEVIDLTGKTIFSKAVPAGTDNYQIHELSEWISGYYLVRVTSHNGVKTLKLAVMNE